MHRGKRNYEGTVELQVTVCLLMPLVVWSCMVSFITITIAAILKPKHLYDHSVSDNIQPLLFYGVTVLWVSFYIHILVSK